MSIYSNCTPRLTHSLAVLARADAHASPRSFSKSFSSRLNYFSSVRYDINSFNPYSPAQAVYGTFYNRPRFPTYTPHFLELPYSQTNVTWANYSLFSLFGWSTSDRFYPTTARRIRRYVRTRNPRVRRSLRFFSLRARSMGSRKFFWRYFPRRYYVRRNRYAFLSRFHRALSYAHFLRFRIYPSRKLNFSFSRTSESKFGILTFAPSSRFFLSRSRLSCRKLILLFLVRRSLRFFSNLSKKSYLFCKLLFRKFFGIVSQRVFHLNSFFRRLSSSYKLKLSGATASKWRWHSFYSRLRKGGSKRKVRHSPPSLPFQGKRRRRKQAMDRRRFSPRPPKRLYQRFRAGKLLLSRTFFKKFLASYFSSKALGVYFSFNRHRFFSRLRRSHLSAVRRLRVAGLKRRAYWGNKFFKLARLARKFKAARLLKKRRKSAHATIINKIFFKSMRPRVRLSATRLASFMSRWRKIAFSKVFRSKSRFLARKKTYGSRPSLKKRFLRSVRYKRRRLSVLNPFPVVSSSVYSKLFLFSNRLRSHFSSRFKRKRSLFFKPFFKFFRKTSLKPYPAFSAHRARIWRAQPGSRRHLRNAKLKKPLRPYFSKPSITFASTGVYFPKRRAKKYTIRNRTHIKFFKRLLRKRLLLKRRSFKLYPSKKRRKLRRFSVRFYRAVLRSSKLKLKDKKVKPKPRKRGSLFSSAFGRRGFRLRIRRITKIILPVFRKFRNKFLSKLTSKFLVPSSTPVARIRERFGSFFLHRLRGLRDSHKRRSLKRRRVFRFYSKFVKSFRRLHRFSKPGVLSPNWSYRPLLPFFRGLRMQTWSKHVRPLFFWHRTRLAKTFRFNFFFFRRLRNSYVFSRFFHSFLKLRILLSLTNKVHGSLPLSANLSSLNPKIFSYLFGLRAALHARYVFSRLTQHSSHVLKGWGNRAPFVRTFTKFRSVSLSFFGGWVSHYKRPLVSLNWPELSPMALIPMSFANRGSLSLVNLIGRVLLFSNIGLSRSFRLLRKAGILAFLPRVFKVFFRWISGFFALFSLVSRVSRSRFLLPNLFALSYSTNSSRFWSSSFFEFSLYPQVYSYRHLGRYKKARFGKFPTKRKSLVSALIILISTIQMPQLDIYGIYHQIIWGILLSYAFYNLVVETFIPTFFSSLYARRELSKRRSDSDFFVLGLTVSAYTCYMAEFDYVSEYALYMANYVSHELLAYIAFLGVAMSARFSDTFHDEYYSTFFPPETIAKEESEEHTLGT